jgi:hypothetical protein
LDVGYLTNQKLLIKFCGTLASIEGGSIVTNIVRAQIIQLAATIGSGTFDENTARSLYAHLREGARDRPDALTVEIGDFFAHPERNRGLIQRHVEPIVSGITASLSGHPASFTVAPITHSEILRALNQELKRHRVPPLGENLDLSLALFAAFQGTSVKAQKKTEVKLDFNAYDDVIVVSGTFQPPSGMAAASFPVLSMPNYLNLPKILTNPFEKGWPLIRVRFENGRPDIFQSSELIEPGMLDKQYAHAGIPYKTMVHPDPFAARRELES